MRPWERDDHHHLTHGEGRRVTQPRQSVFAVDVADAPIFARAYLTREAACEFGRAVLVRWPNATIAVRELRVYEDGDTEL